MRREPRQRYFVGDALAGALHHECQRHNMGLTIHYQLAATGDEAHARKLVPQLLSRTDRLRSPPAHQEFGND